jgi:Transposase DNA-binding/Transposase DDE domain
MITARRALAPLRTEFEGAEFGGRRLSQRLVRIAEVVGASPAESFPDMTGSDGELEGLYRFFSNKKVTASAVLAPHYRATLARIQGQERVCVAHDMSTFSFPGDKRRRGLGSVGKGTDKSQGFYGHFALAVSADGFKTPLGVLGMQTLFRPRRREKFRGHRRRLNPREEWRRWHRLVDETSDRLQGVVRPIHVMDREGDSYALLAHLSSLVQAGFVVRLGQNRRLSGERTGTYLRQALPEAVHRTTRRVPLAKRAAGSRHHSARGARNAVLELRAMQLTIERPNYADRRTSTSSSLPKSLSLHVVHVLEKHPPRGVEPVQWLLATLEPIETSEQVEEIVDFYRTRWVIEEFFKALKTGCGYEKRQLESARALVNALAVFTPVAFRLLYLRALTHHAPAASAQRLLSPTQLSVLRATAKRRLPNRLTARQALLALAALGGHIKNNGEPGWLVLGRGLEKLLYGEYVWNLAMHARDVINP